MLNISSSVIQCTSSSYLIKRQNDSLPVWGFCLIHVPKDLAGTCVKRSFEYESIGYVEK